MRMLIGALALCISLPAVAQDRSMVPVAIDGATVRLEILVYRPATGGPAPTLIFHHGSTGNGRDSTAFTRTFNPRELAGFFTQRGWAVVLPSRRGRGGSEGRYDEGFGMPRENGYSCETTMSLSGADRALRDVDAATTAILAMPFVDRSRVLVGGQSRGGALSIAYAGLRPAYFRGAINFVGGWMGTGCSQARDINTNVFRRGATFPHQTLWLYADNDRFYPVSHSEGNFAAFQAAGGKGAFRRYPAPDGMNGHNINTRPEIWSTDVETYLKGQGLPGK